MDELGLMPQGQTGAPPSPMGAPPGEATDSMGEGITEKDQFVELINQIPIENLIKMVQSMPPEQMAQMIQDLCMQQGMGEAEAISMATTLMKVIYEKVQEATGKPITELTGKTQPAAGPSIIPQQGQQPPMPPGGAI